MHNAYYYHHGDPLIALMSFIVWLCIVGGLIYIVIRILSHHPQLWHNTQDSAADIAKKRYARGEINKAEFDQLLKDLKD